MNNHSCLGAEVKVSPLAVIKKIREYDNSRVFRPV